MSVRSCKGARLYLRSMVLITVRHVNHRVAVRADLSYTAQLRRHSRRGQEPPRGLVRDSAGGNLYGTTVKGGLDSGTVFKIDTSNLTNRCSCQRLHPGGSDGSSPLAGLESGTRQETSTAQPLQAALAVKEPSSRSTPPITNRCSTVSLAGPTEDFPEQV